MRGGQGGAAEAAAIATDGEVGGIYVADRFAEADPPGEAVGIGRRGGRRLARDAGDGGRSGVGGVGRDVGDALVAEARQFVADKIPQGVAAARSGVTQGDGLTVGDGAGQGEAGGGARQGVAADGAGGVCHAHRPGAVGRFGAGQGFAEGDGEGGSVDAGIQHGRHGVVQYVCVCCAARQGADQDVAAIIDDVLTTRQPEGDGAVVVVQVAAAGAHVPGVAAADLRSGQGGAAEAAATAADAEVTAVYIGHRLAEADPPGEAVGIGR